MSPEIYDMTPQVISSTPHRTPAALLAAARARSAATADASPGPAQPTVDLGNADMGRARIDGRQVFWAGNWVHVAGGPAGTITLHRQPGQHPLATAADHLLTELRRGEPSTAPASMRGARLRRAESSTAPAWMEARDRSARP